MKKYYLIIITIINLVLIVGCSSNYNNGSYNSKIDKALLNNTDIIENYSQENKLDIIEQHEYDESLLICGENDTSYHFAVFKLTEDEKNLDLVSSDSILKENQSKVEVTYLSDKVKNIAIVCVLDKEIKQNMNSILIDLANSSEKGLKAIQVSPITNGIGVFEQDINKNKSFIIEQVTIMKENNILYKIKIN